MVKKKFLLVIVLSLVLFIICIATKNKKTMNPVRIKVINKENIISKITTTGYLQGYPQVNISSEIVGKIVKIYGKVGDFVKKGAILCKLDDYELSMELDIARLKYEKVKREYERALKLWEAQMLANEDFEDIECEYRIAEAEYRIAMDRYRKTKIFAPISGTIIQISVEEGEIVIMGTMNNPGTQIMTIADLSKMVAYLKVPEADIPYLRPGQHALIVADALPNKKFTGRVSEINLMPVIREQGSSDFICTVEISEPPFELKPGMTVKAEIIYDSRNSVLTIPIGALVKKGDEDAVFVYHRGQTELRVVKTGITSETDIEIISGLDVGDTVITGPYKVLNKLTDGCKVSLK